MIVRSFMVHTCISLADVVEIHQGKNNMRTVNNPRAVQFIGLLHSVVSLSVEQVQPLPVLAAVLWNQRFQRDTHGTGNTQCEQLPCIPNRMVWQRDSLEQA